METVKTVKDGKMSNEQLGGFHRRVDEIKRRVNEETLQYEQVMRGLQQIIQNQIFGDFKIATAPFDAVNFISKGWKVISEEEDKRSAELREVDFAKVNYVSCPEQEEKYIKGEEKLRRLKETGDILLGATVFMGLWQDYQKNKKNSVLERLYQSGAAIKSYLDFPGTILLAPHGDRSVLYLFRYAGGGWHWSVSWLGHDWDVGDLSAVLPQV